MAMIDHARLLNKHGISIKHTPDMGWCAYRKDGSMLISGANSPEEIWEFFNRKEPLPRLTKLEKRKRDHGGDPPEAA
jgi:ligand-binding SRPBCC domain-containing protein